MKTFITGMQHCHSTELDLKVVKTDGIGRLFGVAKSAHPCPEVK
jgi:hypothetical protein